MIQKYGIVIYGLQRIASRLILCTVIADEGVVLLHLVTTTP